MNTCPVSINMSLLKSRKDRKTVFIGAVAQKLFFKNKILIISIQFLVTRNLIIEIHLKLYTVCKKKYWKT